jgi:hypothetical protein
LIKASITVGAYNKELTGCFNVAAPTEPTITLTPLNGGDKNGVSVVQDPRSGKANAVCVEFGSNDPPGEEPRAGQSWGVEWKATGIGSTWRYGWVQIATFVHATLKGAGVNQELPQQENVLDGMTLPDTGPGKNWGDTPVKGGIVRGQTLTFNMQCKDWCMVESAVAGKVGVWVPIASTTWQVSITAVYPSDRNSKVVVTTDHQPTGATVTKFTPGSQFPNWDKKVDRRYGNV